jgi:anti-sigma regulatory factor (Ser/Thr protein kinase)
VVPVSLGGAGRSFLGHGGRAALGNVPAYASTDAAAAAAADAGRGQERVTCSPPAEPDGPARARAIIGEACRRWGLPELEIPATLVVSELVTNAILHAHGQVLLGATLRGSYVHVRVHDGSSREPVLGPPLDNGDLQRDHGRGLRLVERYCSGWGFLPRADGRGKVVWATLRAGPVGSV